MTISKQIIGAGSGTREERSVNTPKAGPGEESRTGGRASGDLAKGKPVVLSPVCPLRVGEAALKSILDPSFRYTASFDTDLKRTFARVRLERRRRAEHEVRVAIRTSANVSSIVRKPFVVRP